MAAPVLLPIRWQQHRVDVCAILHDHTVTWIARDVLDALQLDTGDFTDEPGHTPLVAAEHLHASAYPLDTVRDLLGDTLEGQALIAWMASRENALATMGFRNVARYAETPALYDGPLYSVQQAAETLSRDPRISTSQGRLFEWLLAKEWITRRGQEYAPTRTALDNGALAVVPRRLPHTGDPYPQIVLTAAGIAQLHTVLGGTDPTVLDLESTR